MGTNCLGTHLHNTYRIYKKVGHLCGEVRHSRGELGHHVPVLPIHAIT